MEFIKKLMNETRMPEGRLGKIMIVMMNFGHAPLFNWGVKKLPGIEFKKILDLGCGGGRNIAKLAKRYQTSELKGIDISPLCVEKAGKHNRKLMEQKRVKIELGDVGKLSEKENCYDLVTAFETIYFWEDLQTCFENVRNCMKKEGVFLIVNELEGKAPSAEKYERIIKGLKVYRVEEIEEHLRGAGFKGIEISRREKPSWIAVTARK